MSTFKFNDRISFTCFYKKARNGFNHEAKLYIDGQFKDSTFKNYSNRTWEAYEFQSVMQSLVRETSELTEQEKVQVQEFLKDGKGKEDNGFGSIAMVALMGEIFTDNKKDANDWKARMIKAGLGEGISMPDDWDTLSEEEKERRLNGVIGILKNE